MGILKELFVLHLLLVSWGLRLTNEKCLPESMERI